MRQTLFYLPHQVGPLPLFGWVSWSMIGLALYIVLIIALSRHRSSWSETLRENGMNWGIAAFALGWLLPWIETKYFEGTPEEVVLGLPVRGYGLMLMLGVVAAVAIANRRIERLAISRDAFLGLALWVIVGGLVGARMFYVVQKWNELDGATILEKLRTALQFTEGGLVVYGSVMGGMAGILFWTIKERVRPIPLLDAVVPAFFIGLALGRIGCLMNGCCYGAVCETNLPAITFPRGSPAYMEQLERGQLLGLRTKEQETQSSQPRVQAIEKVTPDSWAALHGVKPGQTLERIDSFILPPDLRKSLTDPPQLEGSLLIDRQRIDIPSQDYPERSLPVHPSQIYAAISGFLLCLWTLSISNWVKRPGLVFGAGLVGYGIIRILEEIIRVDEKGQFGTSLSISQWVSVLGIAAGVVILLAAWGSRFRPQIPAEAN
ncbi:MAG: prolipoprotein diacylglyceryl transferase [Pirellula sp.]|nr:prolipoprotein diacylglyceryl transferase [Pirellula sp.]